MALVVKAGPKIIASKELSETIYKALPYTYSEAEKKRWVIVAKDKKIIKRIHFLMKLLSYVSGIPAAGLAIFLISEKILLTLTSDDMVIFIFRTVSDLFPELNGFITFVMTGMGLPIGEFEGSEEWIVYVFTWRILKDAFF